MEEKDVPTIKGKMTKPHPPLVTFQDYMDLPKELDVRGWVVYMAIDVMYINDCSFLHAIDRKMKFRALIVLGRKKKKSDHTAEELYEALKRVLRYYSMADVRIKTIHADN